MTIKQELLQGSFRNIPFNFISTGRSGGRKNVFHDYINSDVVNVEDLGLSPKTISMSIRISGLKNNYFNNLNALESALDQEGSGTLVHPTYGKIKVAVNGNYSINENIESLGFAVINVSFTIIEDRVFLPLDETTADSLLSKADFISRKKELDFSVLYQVNSIDSLDQAVNYVNNVSEQFVLAQSLIEDTEKSGEFAAQLLGFKEGTFTSAFDLARDTYLLFYNANNFIESASSRYDFFKSLFGFGDDEPDIPRTTRARVEQADNQDIQRSTIQTSAVAFASVAAVQVDYDTDEQLNLVASDVQTQFIKTLDDDGTTSDIYNLLQELKVLFNKSVSDLTLDVSRIVEVDVSDIGLSTLIYKYYGASETSAEYDDIYNLIKSLNNLEETGLLNGTIKLITESGV